MPTPSVSMCEHYTNKRLRSKLYSDQVKIIIHKWHECPALTPKDASRDAARHFRATV